jgi:hypothetical protein
MWSLLYLVVRALVRLLVRGGRPDRDDGAKDLEILVLRHQLRVLKRTAARPQLRRVDRVLVVHTPVHASWLDQTEIYFSIVQRKVLDPNDFASLAELEARLLAFGDRYSAVATPFEWRFTRLDLHRVLAGLPSPLVQAA